MNNHNASKKIFSSLKFFIYEISCVVKNPIFLFLSLLGNLLIVLFSYIFYVLEIGINPRLHSFIDALWWGFATATTTGYGDITPITVPGKILGIFAMLMGTALFAMFTALFAETILNSSRRHKP
jgi:voltage-gated potassium channel Kch